MFAFVLRASHDGHLQGSTMLYLALEKTVLATPSDMPYGFWIPLYMLLPSTFPGK